MEYFAKILHEERCENGLLKHTFLDIETSQIDCFYHNERINHIPHLPGKLNLSLGNEEECKFYQSFIQTSTTAEEYKRLEALITLEREWKEGIKKAETDFTKRKKKKLTFQEINYLLQKGLSRKEIADYANVSIWTIHRIISRGKRGIIPSNKKRGRKRKIDGYDLAVLYSPFLGSRATTQQERADHLRKERNLKVHRTTILRTFKRDGFTRKRATKQYFERNLEKVVRFIKDNYWLLSLNSLYALDECSFHLNEAPRYAYSRKGCRATVSRPSNKGSNHTLIFCIQNINKQVEISYKIIAEETKAVDFHNFLAEINFPPNQENYLLLDNARIHHAVKKLKELGLLSIGELAIVKNVILKYLPPYAPQLNPAELCINFIRQNYTERKQPKTKEELEKVIKEAIENLQKQDLTKYFQHCFNASQIC